MPALGVEMSDALFVGFHAGHFGFAGGLLIAESDKLTRLTFHHQFLADHFSSASLFDEAAIAFSLL